MLSRVADNLYWMSRYLERAEHTARLLDVNLYLTLDQKPAAAGRRWYRMQACLLPAPVDAAGADASGRARAIAFDLMNRATYATCLAAARENAGAIVACLAASRENARHVRECISSEMWEQLNRLYLATRDLMHGESWHDQPHGFFRGVVEGAHLFHGITDGTMCHDEGWHFTQVGRFLERAAAVAALLDVHGALEPAPGRGDGDDYLQWVGLLRSCAAFEAYCRAHSAEMRPRTVLSFLMLDAELPHSLHHCAQRAERSLSAIAAATRRGPGLPDRLAGRLCASLKFQTIDEVEQAGLQAFLRDVQNQCTRTSEAIHQTYVEPPASMMAGAAGRIPA